MIVLLFYCTPTDIWFLFMYNLLQFGSFPKVVTRNNTSGTSLVRKLRKNHVKTVTLARVP
jgi:hypothetical protein